MKKRVLVLEGSPRRGNTEVVTDWVLKGVGKKGITAGGDHFDGADLAVEMFRRLAEFGKVNYLGQFVAVNCTSPSDMRKNHALAGEAKQFARGWRATLIT